MENENSLLFVKENTGDAFYGVRCSDGFRIVALNKAFTEEAEEELLREACTDELLKKLGLKYTFLPFSLIEDVAYDEADYGNVTIRTRDKRYNYCIFGDYEEERVESFFKGLKRVDLPKRKTKVKEDWRSEKQNPKVLKWVKGINLAFNVISFVSVFFILGGGWFSLASALLWITAVVLCVVFPAYFSPIERRQRKRFGYTTYAADFSLTLVVVPLGLAWSFIEGFTLNDARDYLWLLAMGVVATAAFIMGMHMALRDFREHFGAVFGILCLSVCFFFGAAGYLNHYANLDRQYEPCPVVKMEKRDNSKRSYYYCTVELEDGERVRFSVSGDEYSSLSKGDTVDVFSGEGALGIEYSHLRLD